MDFKRMAIAAALAAGALSSSAFAAAGEAWYGTNRPERVYTQPSFGPLPPGAIIAPETSQESVTVYYEEPTPAPVIVEREYVREPAYVVVPEERENPLFHVEPRSHPTIGHGLFNRTGPNDWGQ